MIGWYVHHQGAGHAQRFAAVTAHLPGVVGLGSGPAAGERWIALPSDATDAPDDASAGDTLHWVPLHHDGLRARMAVISAWIERERPAAMVVDVSVEVALLARLHGVPTVVVAQRGDRSDVPHRLAYAQAAAIVAPWAEETHLHGTLPSESRVRFTGALSRFDDEPFASAAPGGDVLVLVGSGGSSIAAAQVREAARATPERRWHVAGVLGAKGAPNVRVHGAEADIRGLLEHASVVVGSAGANVVAEVAAARRPYVCLPQARPFGEQQHQARALMRLGAALVCPRWPAGERWPTVLAEAEAMGTERWAAWHDGDGARRMAAAIGDAVASPVLTV